MLMMLKKVFDAVRSGKQASATITLASDTAIHSAYDVVSTAAGAVMSFADLGEAGNIVSILSAKVKYAKNALPTAHAGYRLHLYNASPTAIADNAAFNVPATDVGKYLGYLTLSTMVDVGDNCISIDNNINFTCRLVGTGIYGILSCIGAETPAVSAVYTLELNTKIV